MSSPVVSISDRKREKLVDELFATLGDCLEPGEVELAARLGTLFCDLLPAERELLSQRCWNTMQRMGTAQSEIVRIQRLL